MSLTSVITKRIAEELTAKVSSLLSSVSNKVQDTDTIVSQVVAEYVADKRFLENNNLGVLVRRIQELISATETQQEQMSYDALYEKARVADDQIDVTIWTLAHRIAAALANTLNTLKVTIADDCERLVSEIKRGEYVQGQVGRTVDVAQFSWGDLADPIVRAGAIAIARQQTSAYKGTDMPGAFDASSILGVLPKERIADLSKVQVDATGTGMAQALTATLGPKIDDRYAANLAELVLILTTPHKFLFWATDTVMALASTGAKVAENAIMVTQKVDAFASIVSTIMNNDLSLTDGYSDMVRQNAGVIERTIGLIRAVLISIKERDLKGSLILTPQYIQAGVYQEFTQKGGTMEDIVTYIRYMEEIAAGGKLPGRGVPADVVLANREATAAAIQAKDAKDQGSEDLKKRIEFEKVVTSVLTKYFQENHATEPATGEEQAQHDAALTKARFSYREGVVSLYTLVTDYLVATRGDRLVQLLHRALSDEYTAAVSSGDGGAVNDGVVAEITLRVVLSFMWDVLLKPFLKDA